MSQKSSPAGNAVRQVALEITSHEILLVVLNQAHAAVPLLHWRRVGWLQQAASLATAEGMAEFSAALVRLVEQEKLQGMTLDVALSGDFCVTRVVAGPIDKVRQELRNLEERSSMYLSLGSGNKVFTRREQSIDAKRSLAWLTVTNEQTLQAVAAAAQAAGVKLGHIEHSLAGACRAVGRAQLDAESPVLVIEVNRGGVDLGVSYQGRLLLDYRPGGLAAKEQVAETVTRHLARIQRHCHRHFQFAAGDIRRVILCGDAADVKQIREQFEKLGRMQAEFLDLNEMGQNWNLAGEPDDETCIAGALGALLAHQEDAKHRESPDLMEPLLRSQRKPLVPELIKIGWPVAAALLVWLGLALAAGFENWRATALAAQTEEIERSEGQLNTAKLRLAAIDSQMKAHQNIAAKLIDPSWHEVLAGVGGSLPEGVWLDSFACDREGAITISGPSYSEDGIYEFIRNLKNVPLLANIALEGTRSTRLPSGPATVFEVRTEINKQPAPAGGT